MSECRDREVHLVERGTIRKEANGDIIVRACR